MDCSLRLTQGQHAQLKAHLFPGDGNESVALLLCGRREGSERKILTVHDILPIPDADCTSRSPERVTWPTHRVDQLVARAYGNRRAIVKIHSHPTGYGQFSQTDDYSDRTLFASVCSLLADGLPHGSLVMMPTGEIFGRLVGDGAILESIATIMVVGDDIKIWGEGSGGRSEVFVLRHAQAFGRRTTNLLRSCSVAVIGCSGTGSIVVELLARLGVGRVVLIDPDVVEEKNLNRIVSSGKEDSYLATPKVQVLAKSIARMGFGTEVQPIQSNLVDADAVRAVAGCDFVFGCMDGYEGRHVLSRLATFYTLPYFDVGVRLDADGFGGIAGISGAVHYLQPGLSTMIDRGVFTMKQVEADGLRRTDPEMYRRQKREGYIRGIVEDRPAVISVNTFYAALCVNEFLARLHAYRNQDNGYYAELGVSLAEMQFYPEPESRVASSLSRNVGAGDVVPLLGMPSLS